MKKSHFRSHKQAKKRGFYLACKAIIDHNWLIHSAFKIARHAKRQGTYTRWKKLNASSYRSMMKLGMKEYCDNIIITEKHILKSLACYDSIAHFDAWGDKLVIKEKELGIYDECKAILEQNNLS